MANVELKTQLNGGSVDAFLNGVGDEDRRADCFRIKQMMVKFACEEPKMWGPSIVGFGTLKLKYPTGREFEWMMVGFSPRNANLTLYIVDGFNKYSELMARLGKHKTGKSCLYINSLADIDVKVLEGTGRFLDPSRNG